RDEPVVRHLLDGAFILVDLCVHRTVDLWALYDRSVLPRADRWVYCLVHFHWSGHCGIHALHLSTPQACTESNADSGDYHAGVEWPRREQHAELLDRRHGPLLLSRLVHSRASHDSRHLRDRSTRALRHVAGRRHSRKDILKVFVAE